MKAVRLSSVLSSIISHIAFLPLLDAHNLEKPYTLKNNIIKNRVEI
jgi:hypothetical protein